MKKNQKSWLYEINMILLCDNIIHVYFYTNKMVLNKLCVDI